MDTTASKRARVDSARVLMESAAAEHAPAAIVRRRLRAECGCTAREIDLLAAEYQARSRIRALGLKTYGVSFQVDRLLFTS